MCRADLLQATLVGTRSVNRTFGDISVSVTAEFVATIEVHRPPNNYFDLTLVKSLADALEFVEAESVCRVAVLCSEGKHFCAGADFSGDRKLADTTGSRDEQGHLYDEASRLFSIRIPTIAAVQGAAIGGGLGLAMTADFRIACPEARFSANFARLGFHPGFGLTITLPAAIGQQRALEMLYTGHRVTGEEALRIGLCDRLVQLDSLRVEAQRFASEIAQSAPLALRSIKQTMRTELNGRVRLATEREREEQERLSATEDFSEGVQAVAQRRLARFVGK